MLQDQHEMACGKNIPHLCHCSNQGNTAVIFSAYNACWRTDCREQLLRHLAEWAPSVPLLDLTPALLDKARHEPCFHKTDTHWNAIGGMVGAQNILARLR